MGSLGKQISAIKTNTKMLEDNNGEKDGCRHSIKLHYAGGS